MKPFNYRLPFTLITMFTPFTPFTPFTAFLEAQKVNAGKRPPFTDFMRQPRGFAGMVNE